MRGNENSQYAVSDSVKGMCLKHCHALGREFLHVCAACSFHSLGFVSQIPSVYVQYFSILPEIYTFTNNPMLRVEDLGGDWRTTEGWTS